MSKKIIVIGAVAAGASAAARLRRIDEFAEIIVFEKGPHPSFSNCALPNYLSREIPHSDLLLLQTPESFKVKYNIDVRILTEVIKIFPKDKKILAKSLITNKEYEENYDELIIATGAAAILPPEIEGINSNNVFTLKNVEDVRKIDNFIQSKNAKNIVVVGGGFIGLEVMENLRYTRRNVTLIQSGDQVLNPIDYDMAQIIHKEITDYGVKLFLNERVVKITEEKVILKSGKSIDADVVIMAIGVSPETKLAEDCGIELGETGAIKVDHNYQTSKKHVYAVGDVVETHNFLTGKIQRLSMAGVAQRQSRAAADAIYNMSNKNKGVVGASIIRLFTKNIAYTGLSEKICKMEKIDYRTAFTIAMDRVSIMPEASSIFFKLIFAYPSGKILGAQAIGSGAVDKRIDVISTLIQMNGTLEDLKELELSYAPSYSTARDLVNITALIGLNILNGFIKAVNMYDVRKLVEDGEFIVDVREAEEYKMGHIKGAINLPLSQLRSRINELPKDRKIYLHCRSAQRSYLAARILMANGFDEVYNIQGSYCAISHYEYFNDIDKNRESILTQYNFN